MQFAFSIFRRKIEHVSAVAVVGRGGVVQKEISRALPLLLGFDHVRAATLATSICRPPKLVPIFEL